MFVSIVFQFDLFQKNKEVIVFITSTLSLSKAKMFLYLFHYYTGSCVARGLNAYMATCTRAKHLEITLC